MSPKAAMCTQPSTSKGPHKAPTDEHVIAAASARTEGALLA